MNSLLVLRKKERESGREGGRKKGGKEGKQKEVLERVTLSVSPSPFRVIRVIN